MSGRKSCCDEKYQNNVTLTDVECNGLEASLRSKRVVEEIIMAREFVFAG